MLGQPWSLVVVGDLLFASGEFGVETFDLAAPFAPRQRSALPTRHPAVAATVSDGRIYLTDPEFGLEIIEDIAPPTIDDFVSGLVAVPLHYSAQWQDLYPGHDERVHCTVSHGACVVEFVDQEAKTAAISWTSDVATEHAEIAIAIGNAQTFSVARDHVSFAVAE